MARAGLITMPPAASWRARQSMRKTTCSSDPGGIVRTIVAAKLARLMPAVATKLGLTDAEMELNGKVTTSWSAAAARARSRAYQESGEERTAKRTGRGTENRGRGQ